MTYTAYADQQHYLQHPTTVRRVGAAGLVTSLLGVVAVIVSFTTLTWFTDGTVRLGRNDSGTFDIVHDVLVRVPLATGFQVEGEPLAAMYFTWLGWGLLVAVAFAAALANTASGAAPVFRVVGTVLALGAVAVTFAAIDLLSVHPDARIADPSYGEYLAKAGPGFYAAVTGFVLLALGSLLGSRKRG